MKKTLLSVLLTSALLFAAVLGLLVFGANAATVSDPDTTRVLVREADGNNDGSVTDGGVLVFKTIRGATAWAKTQSWGANAKLRIEIDQNELSMAPSGAYLFVGSSVGLITRTNHEALPITITAAEGRSVTLTITEGGHYYLCNDLSIENLKIVSTAAVSKWYFSNDAVFHNVDLTVSEKSYFTASAYVHTAYFLTNDVYQARKDQIGDINTTLTFSGNTTVKNHKNSTNFYLYGTLAFDGETTAPKPGSKFPASFTFGANTLYRHQFNGKVVLRDNAVWGGGIRARNSTYLGDGVVEIYDNATVKGTVQNVFNRGSVNNTANRVEIFGGHLEDNVVMFYQTTWPIEDGSSVELIIHGGEFDGSVSAQKGGTVYEGNKGVTISGGTFRGKVYGDKVCLTDDAAFTLCDSATLEATQAGRGVTVSHEDGFADFDKVYVTAPKNADIRGTGSPASVAVNGDDGFELRGASLPLGVSVVLNERIYLKAHLEKELTDLYLVNAGNPEIAFRMGNKDLGKSFSDFTAESETYALMLPIGAGDFDRSLYYYCCKDLIGSTTVQALAEQGATLYKDTPDEALFKALADYGASANGAEELKYFDATALDLSTLPEASEPVKGAGKIEISEISLLMGDSIGIRFKTDSDLTGISVKVNDEALASRYYSAKDGAIDLYVNAAHLNELLKIEIYDGAGTLSATFNYAVSNLSAMVYENDPANLKAAAVLELIFAIEEKKANPPYTPPTDSESIQHPLDGKKFIFIGNSYTYYGKCVIEKANSVQSQEERSHDKGYFYQIAKENGADIEVTNWTYGNHCLEDTFGGVCNANRVCDGHDHAADLTDRYFDYVMFQESSKRIENFLESVDTLMALFREANPNVKFFCLVPLRLYELDTDECKNVLKNLKTVEEKGVTVVDWGKIVYDVYSGNVQVPDSEMTYNRHSFVISQSESDGHHQNMLAGYITAQMTWCALTGDKAEGQEYRFAYNTSVNTAFDTAKYIEKYYSYGDVTTNFDQVMQSKTEMIGFQKLIDKYLAEKPYRNY